MTARHMNDRRKLSDDERKKAYANRFRPRPALPNDFTLNRTPRESPRMIGGAALRNKDPSEVTSCDLALLARENALPVLERLYEIAMMDHHGSKELAVAVEAACQFLNRAGLYEVKGQVAAIYARVQGDAAKLNSTEKEMGTVEVEKLTDGLGPKEHML